MNCEYISMLFQWWVVWLVVLLPL